MFDLLLKLLSFAHEIVERMKLENKITPKDRLQNVLNFSQLEG